MKANKKRSREIACLIVAEEERCFANAWRAMKLTNGGLLCLGQGIMEGTTYRHTWIEEGRWIIDPSWIDMVDIAAVSYCTLHRWTRAQMRKLPVIKSGKTVMPLFAEWYAIAQRTEDSSGTQ